MVQKGFVAATPNTLQHQCTPWVLLEAASTCFRGQDATSFDSQRTHFCLGLRLLYLRGLRRHVGEGNLDGVLDTVQQLDDHVRHHLERGSVLARRVAHHGVAHLKSNEISYRQLLRMISVFLETISLKRILKLHSYIEALEDGSLLSPRRGDDEEAVDSLQIGRVVGCFLPLRQIQSCQKPRSKRFFRVATTHPPAP